MDSGEAIHMALGSLNGNASISKARGSAPTNRFSVGAILYGCPYVISLFEPIRFNDPSARRYLNKIKKAKKQGQN